MGAGDQASLATMASDRPQLPHHSRLQLFDYLDAGREIFVIDGDLVVGERAGNLVTVDGGDFYALEKLVRWMIAERRRVLEDNEPLRVHLHSRG